MGLILRWKNCCQLILRHWDPMKYVEREWGHSQVRTGDIRLLVKWVYTEEKTGKTGKLQVLCGKQKELKQNEMLLKNNCEKSDDWQAEFQDRSTMVERSIQVIWRQESLKERPSVMRPRNYPIPPWAVSVCFVWMCLTSVSIIML